MKSVRIEKDGHCCVLFQTNGGLPNAVRRALLADVQNYAPKEVCIRTNTSSQTDEYIAHRIGLIPFVLVGEHPDEPLRLTVSGRAATTRDLQGRSFRAVHDMGILCLSDSQSLDLDVCFHRGTGSQHVKFSHIGPVAYSRDGDTGKTELKFKTITNTCPLLYLESAIRALIGKIDDAKQQLTETVAPQQLSGAAASQQVANSEASH